MPVQHIPEIFLPRNTKVPEVLIHDFKMTEEVVKSKVHLTLHMFSFLQTGEKKLHFEDAHVTVNNQQSVLVRSGNWLFTELLDHEQVYFCKLFFFSTAQVTAFFEKHPTLVHTNTDTAEKPFFVITNDDFIHAFVTAISAVFTMPAATSNTLLAVKFEEIMLYLAHKYGTPFISYLQSLTAPEYNASFRQIVEANIHTHLNIAEIAFLANMSLSSFKRHFNKIYQANPGKWLQQKRLQQAKKILEKGDRKPSEIYARFGYTNLSSFSIAYKKEFGCSPKNSSRR